VETHALLSLALSLTEAAFDGVPLHDSLRSLGKGLGADEVMLYQVDPSGTWSDVHSLRTTADVLEEYHRHALPQSPRRPVWESAPFSVPLDFDALVPPELLDRGAVGAIMRRTGFPSRHIAGLKLRVAPGIEARFSIGRNGGGRFEPRVHAAIEALAPHLATTFRARTLLAPAPTPMTEEVRGLGDVELLPLPLALADATPRLVHVNARLKLVTARRDGLAIDRGRLVAEDRAADAALDRAARELPTAQFAARAPMRAINVPRTGAAIPYLVQAIAIGRGGPAGRGVLFVVTDPEASRPEPELLRRTLGLTLAEASLAGELATGATLAAAARARGIGLETARSQLKAVLAKTGCPRQQDLARLLARLGASRGTA
jgi:DNA-binding CsgD family transcriptional regulator